MKNLKKSKNVDPNRYFGKPFSWFYVNFYDKKDIKNNTRYDPYKFVFDEEEFKELVKEANIQIEDWPYN